MMSMGILKKWNPKVSQLHIFEEIPAWQLAKKVNFKDKIILKVYILENFDLKIDLEEYSICYFT